VYHIAVEKGGVRLLHVNTRLANVQEDVLAHVVGVVYLNIGRLQGFLGSIALRVLKKVLMYPQDLLCTVIS
jgi:hypothetical protein